MTTALLADLTALFLASRTLEREKNLDYLRLDQCLKNEARVKSFDFALVFTSFDPNNEGQRKFLDFVGDRLGWTVDRVHTNDAILRPPTSTSLDVAEARPFVRFDARIAFCLGRLAGQFEHVIVVSDSYALAAPILETVERGTKVTLAFFGQLLDTRYGKLIHKVAPSIAWLDLDKHLAELFGGDRYPSTEFPVSGLRRLP